MKPDTSPENPAWLTAVSVMSDHTEASTAAAMQTARTKLRWIGASVGLVSAGLGVGGGAMLVPAYLEVTRFRFKEAAGTSLSTIIPIVFVGLAGQLLIRDINLNWVLLVTFIAAALTGGVLAARFLAKIKEGKWLKYLFGLFLILAGGRMTGLFNLFPASLSDFGDGWLLWPATLAFGLLAGTVSALLGVGAGLAIVPFLVIVAGFPMPSAVVHSLAIMLVMTSFNAFVHKKVAHTDLGAARVAIPPALLGAVLGILISSALPGPVLRQIFGAFLLIIGMRYCIPTKIPNDKHLKKQPLRQEPEHQQMKN